MSKFDKVAPCAPDPIFGVEAFFNACPLKEKQLLSVGVYRDGMGLPYTFPSVARAEDLIIHKHNKEYIPMIGFRPFLNVARSLLWPDDVLAEMGNRIATVQSVAGTGAIHLCSHFCKCILNVPQVMISDPAWPSYSIIFGDLGHNVTYYPYIKDGLLNLGGICNSVEAAPEGSLIVLQVCGHNPTGIDPTYDEWQAILQVCRNRRHIVLFDFAYMGFASADIDEDARIVRECARSGMEFFCAFSFSKCMGLYGERVGALHVVSNEPKCRPII
jgi:aspartate/tyrosine/aromatic aminotransferase